MTDIQYWEGMSKVATRLFSRDDGAVIWRRFHCLCCRAVWEFIEDERCRDAICIAESYCDGIANYDKLLLSHMMVDDADKKAWERVRALMQHESDCWPLTDETDQAWVQTLCCSAVKTAVQPDFRSSLLPDSAASVRAWAFARTNLRLQGIDVDSEASRLSVNKEWDRINAVERESQWALLIILVDGLAQ